MNDLDVQDVQEVDPTLGRGSILADKKQIIDRIVEMAPMFVDALTRPDARDDALVVKKMMDLMRTIIDPLDVEKIMAITKAMGLGRERT
jgi:hypothetical protein